MALMPDVGGLLSGFHLERVLSEDAASKSAALLGRRVFWWHVVWMDGEMPRLRGVCYHCCAPLCNGSNCLSRRISPAPTQHQ